MKSLNPKGGGKVSFKQERTNDIVDGSNHAFRFAILLRDGKYQEEKVVNNPSVSLDPFYTSPDQKIDDDLEEHLNTIDDDDEEIDIGGNDNLETAPERQPFTGIDINIPHQQESDDEINLSDDDGDNGPSAAEALRAQVNAEESKQPSSSSSESSSSSSSSSDSDSSGDSVTSI
nr:ELL-associated factor 1 [Tanacetum cinerariifolium]